MHEIAQKLNVSIGSVYNYCKIYGIDTRNKKETFNFKGHTQSERVKEIISKAHKGKILSEETKTKISKAHIKGGIMSKKKRCDGYIAIYFPDHPKSTKDGYIMEHILVMECLLGRHLNEDEVVHHQNGIKDDNRKENLQLMTKSEHMTYHAKKRWEALKDAQQGNITWENRQGS